MGYTRGQRAFAQAEAFDQSQTYPPAGVVPLDDDEFKQVTRRVGNNFAIADRGFFPEVPGDNLSWLDTNHFNKSGPTRYT